jgi:transcriptional regulator with XRE-family HTH domain
MNVNQRIREVRKAMKMTQIDFAKALCISNSYLADIENDYRKANDRIIKLASNDLWNQRKLAKKRRWRDVL